MYYRYKRRLLRFFYYLMSTMVLSYLYVEAAHRHWLPAVFEYYTGDWVRKHTVAFWDPTTKPTTERAQSRYSFHWQNILDILTREPGYLAARNLLEHTLQVWESLPHNINRKELLLSLASDATLIEWLRNPKSRFADIYQYEFLQRMDHYRYITGYRITDHNGRELYRSSSFEEATVPTSAKSLKLEKKGFNIPISDNFRTVGYLQGTWDPAWFPDLPTANTNQAGFTVLMLSPTGFLYKTEAEYPQLRPFIVEFEQRKKYTGPLSGNMNGLRIISASVDATTILVIYQAAHWTFYLFQILLWFAAAGVAYLSYLMLRKVTLRFKERPLVRRSVWLEEDLKASYALQRESLELLRESTRYLQDSRRREADTMVLNATQLETLKRMVTQETVVLTEKKSLPKETEQQEQTTTPLLVHQNLTDTLYQAPSLPEPEILTADADNSITVIDEMPTELTSTPQTNKAQLTEEKVKKVDEIVKLPNLPTSMQEEQEEENLEALFSDIFADITDELDDGAFDELLGNLQQNEGNTLLTAPSEFAITPSLPITDEEPVPAKQAKAVTTQILCIMENLEKKTWELVDAFQTPQEGHLDEDLDILSVDPSLSWEPPTPVVPIETIAPNEEEIVLFEDDDVEDLLTSGAIPTKTPSRAIGEDKFGYLGHLQYKAKPEILKLKFKPRPLVLEEKLEHNKTTLNIIEE